MNEQQGVTDITGGRCPQGRSPKGLERVRAWTYQGSAGYPNRRSSGVWIGKRWLTAVREGAAACHGIAASGNSEMRGPVMVARAAWIQKESDADHERQDRGDAAAISLRDSHHPVRVPAASRCVSLRPPASAYVRDGPPAGPSPLICTTTRLNHFVHYGVSTLRGSVTRPLRRTDGERDTCDLASKEAERC